MREILHRFSIILLFIYMCTVYICSYTSELIIFSHIAFVALFGITLFYVTLRGDLIFLKSLFLMFAFWTVTVISYYWAFKDINVVERNITILLLILLVVVITNILVEEKNIDIALKILYFAGMIMCIYSLFFYGYEATIQALVAETNIRLGGEINQANTFGMICSITTILGVYFAFYKGEGIYYFITLIPLIYAFASGSKKVILIFIIALVVLIANKKGKSFMTTALIWLISIAAILIIINYLNSQNLLIFSRFDTFMNLFGEKDYNTVIDNSSTARMGMIKDGIKWFLKKPFWGYGTDQYKFLYFESYGIYWYSHSTVIEVLVNHGLVGFFAYYSLHLYIFVKLLRGVKRKVNNSVGMLMMFAMLIVMDLFSVMLYEKTYYIMIAIILSYIGINKEKLGKKPLTVNTVMEEGK